MTADIRTAAQSGEKLIHDFRGDDVWRDDEGMIWQRITDTEKVVKAAMRLTIARVTPTREQLAETMFNAYGDTTGTTFDKENPGMRHLYLVQAEAVLALLAGLAEGES